MDDGDDELERQRQGTGMGLDGHDAGGHRDLADTGVCVDV